MRNEDLQERVTRALEEALAQHGIAFDPVDDAAGVAKTMVPLLETSTDEQVRRLGEAMDEVMRKIGQSGGVYLRFDGDTFHVEP